MHQSPRFERPAAPWMTERAESEEPTASAGSEERKNGSKTAVCQIDIHCFVAWLEICPSSAGLKINRLLLTKRDVRATSGRRRASFFADATPPADENYLISTLAPAASIFFLISSASALVTPSLIVLGAPSTSALASARPRPGHRAANFLDHADLVRAHLLQDDFESRLSLRAGAAAAAASAAGRSRRRRHRSRCADAPLFFELLHQSSNLENGQAAELLHDFVCICHFFSSDSPPPKAFGELSRQPSARTLFVARSPLC